ncbi:MAG TPA: SDR family NAD(P)-dependent oxidoreductase [Kofleriaceae bacterium]|nr:SDR family NAD(P)-dependent oxidoreductase [Kofleriaceae bacterium]
MATSSARPLALVTGASSGIGASFAKRLARDGHDLVAVARRRDRLEELAASLPGCAVEIVQADLGTDEGLAAVCTIAAERPLALLVNNAGLAHYMPFVDLPADKAQELVRVNVLAPTMIARAAAAPMARRGAGAIINVASLLAFSGAAQMPHLPQRAVYAGTRAFVVTFSQVLAAELAGSGVRVQALCPGIVRTEFHTRQGIDLSARPRAEPDDVVAGSLAGLELGEVVCAPMLEDAGALERLKQAELAVLGAAQVTELASRYRGR